ncbi:hypothetical protein PMAYCL1PPCAC_30658, partial [Pristionchus mayeri]
MHVLRRRSLPSPPSHHIRGCAQREEKRLMQSKTTKTERKGMKAVHAEGFIRDHYLLPLLMWLLQGRMMRPLSDIYEIIERLAQMMIVTRCRCSIRRSKSESHLNCFHMDSWIQEEFRNCVDIAKEIEAFAGSRADNDSPDFPMYAESLDSL